MRRWPNAECPTCGARPHEMCRTPRGQKAKQHTTRPVGPLDGVSKPITRQMETLAAKSDRTAS